MLLHCCHACEKEHKRLRAQNARLLAALAKIVELGHYPDESIARAAIDEAKSS